MTLNCSVNPTCFVMSDLAHEIMMRQLKEDDNMIEHDRQQAMAKILEEEE